MTEDEGQRGQQSADPTSWPQREPPALSRPENAAQQTWPIQDHLVLFSETSSCNPPVALTEVS